MISLKSLIFFAVIMWFADLKVLLRKACDKYIHTECFWRQFVPWKYLWHHNYSIIVEKMVRNTNCYHQMLAVIKECTFVCLSMQISVLHSCSSVRVFLSILAHLAHLAQVFNDLKCNKYINVFIYVWAYKYKKACQWTLLVICVREWRWLWVFQLI